MPSTVLSFLLVSLLSSDASAAGDDRDLLSFARWAGDHPTRAFRDMLVEARLYGVVPIDQLLRSASDWRLCHADPFAIPPSAQWPAVRTTLELLQHVRQAGILSSFEVVSAYRGPALNACAGGAKQSAHLRAFAVDLLLPPDTDLTLLYTFWRDHGADWNMGLGRYPSGRIHIDTAGYRSW
ncbi:D-Ala-D-Ala carboxypeptidase family metallohydrolase [Pseudomonas sp.]|uniref:YcbK family protein n=1 Tax=Pseudomonas sp. TaxID=306 RepID=UPI0028A807AE|nr:D-Ala-D-Ala carboxypeptidase family metallohydrolase [Pseudomonas sp.]